jgi:3-hydroxybutyryl-CoA dehydrogenase
VVDIKTVGVIGAGQMGSGIAHVCALAGYEVLLHDVSQDRIDQGIGLIEKNMVRQVSRGLIEHTAMEAAMGRIKAAPELQTIGAVDLAIEAATENEETKKQIFKALSPHLSPTTLLASNTSSISITRLASSTDRPDKFIGLHFMNPVPVMKLVEGIKGLETSDETFNTVAAVAEAMGKTFVRAQDYPGFAVNRILMPMINEAFYALYEGVASAKDIDTAMKLGTNQPMGPLELADFIGLDTCLAIMEVLFTGLSDSKYRPCPLLKQYVAAGRFGRKNKKGVYVYE